MWVSAWVLGGKGCTCVWVGEEEGVRACVCGGERVYLRLYADAVAYVCVYVCVYMSICLNVYMSICLYAYMSICPYVYNMSMSMSTSKLIPKP